MILKFQCIRLTLPSKGLKGKKLQQLYFFSFLKSITSEVKTWYGLLGVLPILNFIVGAKVPIVKWPFEEKTLKFKYVKNKP